MKPQLIKTIEEVKLHVPVNMTSDFDTMATYLATAESAYVLRLIGDIQFDALKAAYADPDADAKLKTAVDHAQRISANLGYYFAIPVISLSIGASGIQIFSNQDTKQAFQWQVEALKNSLVELGFNAIEDLLSLLESDDQLFAGYQTSDQLARSRQLLIRNAADFELYFAIGESRFVFQTISYIMKRVEEREAKLLFGSDFYQSLKADGLTAAKQKLVETYIKPGVALITAAKAIKERVISLKNGIVAVNFQGRSNNSSESVAPSAEAVGEMYNQLSADGSAFLQDGIAYVTANLSEFQDYVTPEPYRGRFKFKNDRCKGVFGI